MYEVCVLQDGYSKITEFGSKANCTCTLIKGPKNVIVDTLTAWDKDVLLESLYEHNLKPEDIDYVVCTHGHSDHIGNNNLFLEATHIVGNSISKRDVYFKHDFEKVYNIDNGVRVVGTPGHTLSDVSVLVDTTDGVIAVVGDLFEKVEDLEDENVWKEAGSENAELQEKNRKKILSLAKWIIPGHGPKFQVTDELKRIANI